MLDTVNTVSAADINGMATPVSDACNANDTVANVAAAGPRLHVNSTSLASDMYADIGPGVTHATPKAACTDGKCWAGTGPSTCLNVTHVATNGLPSWVAAAAASMFSATITRHRVVTATLFRCKEYPRPTSASCSKVLELSRYNAEVAARAGTFAASGDT